MDLNLLCYKLLLIVIWASQVALVIKNTPANAGDIKDIGSLGWEDSPGGGLGNSLQYPCLENPHGQKSCPCSPWCHKESDRTKAP